jgi:hypothetical protein
LRFIKNQISSTLSQAVISRTQHPHTLTTSKSRRILLFKAIITIASYRLGIRLLLLWVILEYFAKAIPLIASASLSEELVQSVLVVNLLSGRVTLVETR